MLKTSGSGRTYLDFLDVLLTAQVRRHLVISLDIILLYSKNEDGSGLTDLEIRNEVGHVFCLRDMTPLLMVSATCYAVKDYNHYCCIIGPLCGLCIC